MTSAGKQCFTMELSTCMASWELAGMYEDHRSPGRVSNGELLHWRTLPRGKNKNYSSLLRFRVRSWGDYKSAFASHSSGHITLSSEIQKVSCSACTHCVTDIQDEQRSTKKLNTCVKQPAPEIHHKSPALLRYPQATLCACYSGHDPLKATPDYQSHTIIICGSTDIDASWVTRMWTRRESVCESTSSTALSRAAIVPVERPGYRCPCGRFCSPRPWPALSRPLILYFQPSYLKQFNNSRVRAKEKSRKTIWRFQCQK